MAFALELWPRTTWRKILVQIFTNCQRLQQWELSQGRESIVWTLRLWLEQELQSCTERIRFSVPICLVCSFTHRGVSRGAKNVPHRLRFTRALLQNKDFSMWFCLSLSVWFPELSPSSGETASEKRSPGTAFSPSLGSALQKRWRKRASCGQEEAPNWTMFGSLYLEVMG